MRQLANSVLRHYSLDAIVTENGNGRLVCTWPYGDLYTRQAPWWRLGIGQVIAAHTAGRRFGFDVERGLLAMVAN